MAEQVRAAVERGRIRRTEGSESIGGVTVSIGIAASLAGEPFESLMLRADRALYQVQVRRPQSRHAGADVESLVD